MSKFWSWTKAEDKSELILDGPIASESWFEDEVSPRQFREELEAISGDITVRINSPGGDVFAGVAIYNMLSEREGRVTIKVDGLAASIASLIAMAGDSIIMLPGSMFMVHKPWTIAAGNADELKEVITQLEQAGKSMIPIYAERTGLSEDKIEELLTAGTWMTADEAVELGFADEAIKAKGKTLSDSIKDVMGYATTVNEAVMQPVMSLKAHEEKAEEAKEEEAEDVTDATETVDESVADEAKEESADDEAEEQSEEEVEETESVEVSETTDEETKDNSDEEKEVKAMSKEIAQSQVLEPAAQATVDAAPSVKDYLKTKDSMEAFAKVLQDTAGQGSDAVRAAWKEHLAVKAGVTNPEVFLPETLIQEIQDVFEAGGEIWNRVTKTGADVWRSAWDVNEDVDAETGRAKGYNRSVEEAKAEQELTFAERVLRPAMVFKYITLNREDVKKQRSSGALVRFVLAELPRRIIREVERAIVIGDGRVAGSAYKIQEGNPEGFYPIASDTAANNAFGSSVAASGNAYADLLRARDEIRAQGAVVMIAKRGYITDVLLQENANGSFLFAPGTNVGAALGFSAVVEPDWMDSSDDDAYLVVLENYRVVGDTSIEAFTNFELKTNKQEYLQEIFAGGGLTVNKSAVAIAGASS